MLGTIEARKAYEGNLTKLAIKFVEKYKLPYVILSAKYGFLFPDEKIKNYDLTFDKKSLKTISIQELKKQILKKSLLKYDTIIVIGGKSYVEIVKKVFKNKRVLNPLEGLRYGQKLKRLKDAISGMYFSSILKEVTSSPH